MPQELIPIDSSLDAQSLTSVHVSPSVMDPHVAAQIREACRAWLAKSQSKETRSNYERDLNQFLAFTGIPAEQREMLVKVLPRQVTEWRDHLSQRGGTEGKGLTNNTVLRKLTVLRSLYSYLKVYGYTGINPAHRDFVKAPVAPRDGKTVGLSPEDCRRLLDAPVIERQHKRTTKIVSLPEGIRDRAMLAVLAYTGCRVGELCRLRVGDYKTSSGHRLLEVQGKGGKERRVPLHSEAVERLEAWLDCSGGRDNPALPLFRPTKSARGCGIDGFALSAITRRAVQYLVRRYVRRLKLEATVSVHSFRVTALTIARERGSDIIDLQDFAGHADPRTTLTYIRNRDRLSKSPAYVLRY